MPSTQPRRSWRVMSLGLLGLGLTVSVYLLLRTFALLSEHDPDSIDICSTLFHVDCDLTLQSPISWFLGIPLAAWGVLYYATLASLLLLGWGVGRGLEGAGSAAAFMLSMAGVVASLFLSLWIATGRVAFCPICVVVHVVNLTLPAVLWRLTGGSAFHEVRAAWQYIIHGRAESPEVARWRVVAFLSVGLFAGAMYQWSLVQTERRENVANALDPVRALTAYTGTVPYEIPTREDEPRIGPAVARVRLVVFSSFGCPGCAALAAHLRELAVLFHGELTIVFKHFPAGRACDASPETGPPACTAAYAAEAARLQGRFWEFHDALYASPADLAPQYIKRVAHTVGLDGETFETDLGSDTVRQRVRADQDLARQLGVTTTPTVFLNGRRVAEISRRRLELLIVHELGASAR